MTQCVAIVSVVVLVSIGASLAFPTDGWRLVFRATAGNGKNAAKAWKTGAATTAVRPTSMDRSTGRHYRDPVIGKWGNLNVNYVKYALYEAGQEVASIVFRGKGSTHMNWFNKHRVISSSWPSLTRYATYNHFGIEGHESSYLERNFFINTLYNGCDVDVGYVVTVEKAKVKACAWDKQPAYPQFLFSKINGPDLWNKHAYGRADYLAVFILN